MMEREQEMKHLKTGPSSAPVQPRAFTVDLNTVLTLPIPVKTVLAPQHR